MAMLSMAVAAAYATKAKHESIAAEPAKLPSFLETYLSTIPRSVKEPLQRSECAGCGMYDGDFHRCRPCQAVLLCRGMHTCDDIEWKTRRDWKASCRKIARAIDYLSSACVVKQLVYTHLGISELEAMVNEISTMRTVDAAEVQAEVMRRCKPWAGPALCPVYYLRMAGIHLLLGRDAEAYEYLRQDGMSPTQIWPGGWPGRLVFELAPRCIADRTREYGSALGVPGTDFVYEHTDQAHRPDGKRWESHRIGDLWLAAHIALVALLKVRLIVQLKLARLHWRAVRKLLRLPNEIVGKILPFLVAETSLLATPGCRPLLLAPSRHVREQENHLREILTFPAPIPLVQLLNDRQFRDDIPEARGLVEIDRAWRRFPAAIPMIDRIVAEQKAAKARNGEDERETWEEILGVRRFRYT